MKTIKRNFLKALLALLFTWSTPSHAVNPGESLVSIILSKLPAMYKDGGLAPEQSLLLPVECQEALLWAAINQYPQLFPYTVSHRLNTSAPLVDSALFSPKGRQLIIKSKTTKSNTAYGWSNTTNQFLLLPTPAPSLDPDVLTKLEDNDRTAHVYDARTRELICSLIGHTKCVNSLTFSPDRTRIVTGSNDKTARIWDAQSGKCLCILIGHTHWVSSANFSPDGKQVVTGSNDNTARIWDAQTGDCLRVLNGHTKWVNSVNFNLDGQRVVTGSSDNEARIWNAQTGHCLYVLPGHTLWVNSAEFSPGGQRVVTGSNDGTAAIWERPELAKIFVQPNDKTTPRWERPELKKSLLEVMRKVTAENNTRQGALDTLSDDLEEALGED